MHRDDRTVLSLVCMTSGINTISRMCLMKCTNGCNICDIIIFLLGGGGVSTPLSVVLFITVHKTSCIYIPFLKMCRFQPRQSNKCYKWKCNAAGCGTLLSGLIGVFVCDILQIPIVCIHIHCEVIAATGNPLSLCMV
jgi:hypothetical protein